MIRRAACVALGEKTKNTSVCQNYGNVDAIKQNRLEGYQTPECRNFLGRVVIRNMATGIILLPKVLPQSLERNTSEVSSEAFSLRGCRQISSSFY